MYTNIVFLIFAYKHLKSDVYKIQLGPLVKIQILSKISLVFDY